MRHAPTFRNLADGEVLVHGRNVTELVWDLAGGADIDCMPTPRFVAVRRWGLRTFKRHTMLRLSGACLVIELLIAASTLAPDAPLLPQWPQFVLLPLVFVVHLSSVLRVTPETGRPRWRQFLTGLPPVVIVGFILLFVGAWLGLLASILAIGGQPTMSGGRYYLNEHGLVPVSYAVYHHALILQQRIFTLGPAAFFAVGVLAHYPRGAVGADVLAGA